MKSILALVGTGSTLALVGVALLLGAAALGLHDATGWRLWLCLLIVGLVSVAVGGAAFYASKSHVDTAVEENLTVAGQAKQLPWVAVGAAVVAGLALSRFVRWASHGSIVPTTAPPKPPDVVPVAAYEPPPVRTFVEPPPVRRQVSPPPRRRPEPPSRPLFGELGTALRGLGESALSSVLSYGAKTLGEKLLAQVFEGGLPGATAPVGHHDRRRNGSHPSASF